MSKHDEMVAQATQAYKNAYAPYSNFLVGVCLRTDDDRLFSGCNVENAAYGSSLCAEASALGAMISNGGRKIKEIVIVVPDKKLCPPCGACRQRLYEFSSLDTLIYFYNGSGDHKVLTMGELLPAAFGPANLDS